MNNIITPVSNSPRSIRTANPASRESARFNTLWFHPTALLLAACVWMRVSDYATAAEEASTTQKPSTAVKVLCVADFEQATTQTLAGAPWETFNDSVMGGKSTIQISVTPQGAKGSQHGMLMSTKLTTDFQWGGFAGIRASLSSPGGTTNLSAFTGVQFYARGDGKTYRALVGRQSVKDGNHFYGEFVAPAQWTLVQVPFTKLVQSPDFGTRVAWSAEDVEAIGFLARAEPGKTAEMSLELDDIGLYSAK